MINEDELKKKFGDTVRTLRKQKDYSQELIAEKTALHRTYISDVERGDRNISLVNIMKICHALDIKPSSFFKQIETEDENN